MALIKCPGCGKDVSNKAKSCPKCDCPIKPSKSFGKFAPDSVTNEIKWTTDIADINIKGLWQNVTKKQKIGLCGLAIFIVLVLFGEIDMGGIDTNRKVGLTEVDETAIRAILESYSSFSMYRLHESGDLIFITVELAFKPFSEAQVKDLARDACLRVANLFGGDRPISIQLRREVGRYSILGDAYGEALYYPGDTRIRWSPQRRWPR